jgi:hypothetical protein
MGSGNSTLLFEKYPQLDRTIDDENRIYVGIIPQKGSDPYSIQALQVGRGYLAHIYRLENFIENTNSLVYEFEYEYKLTLTKRNKSSIFIRLTHDNKLCKPVIKMDDLTRKLFKSFGNETTIEFNKLYDFIRIE